MSNMFDDAVESHLKQLEKFEQLRVTANAEIQKRNVEIEALKAEKVVLEKEIKSLKGERK